MQDCVRGQGDRGDSLLSLQPPARGTLQEEWRAKNGHNERVATAKVSVVVDDNRSFFDNNSNRWVKDTVVRECGRRACDAVAYLSGRVSYGASTNAADGGETSEEVEGIDRGYGGSGSVTGYVGANSNVNA